MAIRGVIFDLGGTLLHVPPPRGDGLGPACDAHLQAFLRALGVEAAQADATIARARGAQASRRPSVRQFTLETNLTRALRQTGVRLAPRLVGAAALVWWQPEFRLWERADGLDEVLGAVAAAGLPAGICSNTACHAYTAHLVVRHGLAGRLAPVVTSAATGWRKPHPRAFLPLLAAWGLPPAEVAMVGDDLECDVAGAAALGLQTVWVTAHSRCAAHRYRGPAPTWTAAGLREVPALLGL